MAIIYGTLGDDDLAGTATNDVLYGYAGDDYLDGGAGNDLLYGGPGNDILDGGFGIDTMIGGAGDDIYIVNNPADVTKEESSAYGIDVVLTFTTNHILGEWIEGLLFLDTTNATGYGNNLDNVIFGNIGNDLFYGYGGDDWIAGDAGNDILYGSIGNDLLEGGNGNDYLYGQAGDDYMSGGNGNDTYGINSAGDTVTEDSAVGGYDTINATVSSTLGANLERLNLTGTAAISGSGNALNNTIVGNDASNYLFGGDGNDYLYGGTGNDTLLGYTGNDYLYGQPGNDFLSGLTGNDYLNGGSGNDTLYGGDNADFLVFDTALGSTNVDTITDFYRGEGDRIYLDNDIFSSLGYTGTLASTNFRSSATGTAADSNDYILYKYNNNSLYYDRDGNGGIYSPIKFATVNFHISEDNLLAVDFTVIA